MNYSMYIAVFLVLLVVLMQQRRRRRTMRMIRNRRRNTCIMNELLKSLTGKNCRIYVVESVGSVTGVIAEVSERWVAVDTKKGRKLLNADYIVQAEEVPVKA
ncbi:MAG: hypothetical protein IJL26_01615 [Clostridia bacterium]|nr:hypothetical protein [Clostridia bacterium]